MESKMTYNNSNHTFQNSLLKHKTLGVSEDTAEG